VFFQVPDAPKPVFGQGSAPDPSGGAYDSPHRALGLCPHSPRALWGAYMTLPQIPIRLGRAEIPILWVFPLSEGGRSKANMS